MVERPNNIFPHTNQPPDEKQGCRKQEVDERRFVLVYVGVADWSLSLRSAPRSFICRHSHIVVHLPLELSNIERYFSMAGQPIVYASGPRDGLRFGGGAGRLEGPPYYGIECWGSIRLSDGCSNPNMRTQSPTLNCSAHISRTTCVPSSVQRRSAHTTLDCQVGAHSMCWLRRGRSNVPQDPQRSVWV